MYKNFYGNKMENFKNNKKSQKELLRNYFDVKTIIIQNKNINDLYSKYREILPKLTINKIKFNKEQNKKLKEQPVNYAKSLYHTKYIDSINKGD